MPDIPEMIFDTVDDVILSDISSGIAHERGYDSDQH